MTYKVKLLPSEEGYAVWVPALPGCCSQGETEAEALDNIQNAIQEYLAAIAEMRHEDEPQGALEREVEVAA